MSQTPVNRLPLRTALKIALRDLAASRGKFIFVVFAIMVGVGSLAGVRGFSRAFKAMLAAEARTLMAADLSVRVFELPTPEQVKAMDLLTAGGARRTTVTEVVSMLSWGDANPVLVSLKAVDPALYPFYGELKLDPARPVSAALTPESITVGDDLLVRTGLKLGDRVRLGEADFTIAATVRSEPDRMTGSLNAGPRVMLSREALDRTGLIKPGSRAAQRQLFQLNLQTQDVDRVRTQLRAAFPSGLITDYRETHPLISRGLERSERFASLVSLIALIIGGMGVAATMHAHLEQRLDSIAIMKCLGGQTSQIARIYLLQTAAIGLLGGVLGAILGLAVQMAFPPLIARFFDFAPAFQLDPWSSLEAIAIGLLTAALFTWPSLLSIRRIPPAVILRRDVTAAGPRFDWPVWGARAVIVLAIAGIAAWLAGEERVRVGIYFAGGLLASLLILSGFAWLLLTALRAFLKAPRLVLPSSVRHGLANIYRPGNQANAVLVSLGIGVMFTATVFLMQRGMLSQMIESAPPNMPNVFLINITSRDLDPIRAWLNGRGELVPTLGARLTAVNGRAPSQRRFEQARGVSYAATPRKLTEIVRGRWPKAAGEVCVFREPAQELGIDVGAKLEWEVGLQPLRATVTCLFKTEEGPMAGRTDFVFSPPTLAPFPVQYYGLLRMKPADIPAFQRDTFRQFRSITVINLADLVAIVQEVVDQIAIVVRFISAFAIAAGAIILASSIAATRFRRAREVAILKTLGATRSRVSTIFSMEFSILGAAAGTLGSLMATLFSNLLLVRFFEAKALFDWQTIGAAVLLTVLIANLAGWLASFRILGQKPLEVLRGD